MEGASPTVQTSGDGAAVEDDVVEYMNMPSQPVVLPSLSQPMVLSSQPSVWPEMDPNRALNSETGKYSYIGQFQSDDFDYTDLDIELENWCIMTTVYVIVHVVAMCWDSEYPLKSISVHVKNVHVHVY